MSQSLRTCVFLSLSLLLLISCDRPPSNPSAVSPGPNYFKTHFQDESQFIVETILTDLTEMASYSRSNQLPPGLTVTTSERSDSQFRKPHYDVTIASGTNLLLQGQLLVDQPIWSPELYTKLIRLLIGDAKPRYNAYDANDLSVLLTLADLKPATIETENRRISSLLATNFSDPTLHEMAAVVLGAFALRDFSGDFYDVRLPLCRMTAHLALAQALSGNAPGINGRVAVVMLDTLMNNQTNALEKLKALEGEPQLKPWVSALRVRNTYDYRELQNHDNLTRLEWTAFFLAVSRCINADAAWKQLPDELVKSSSDFTRIANGGDYSVSLGHELLEASLVPEFAEIGWIQSQASEADPSMDELIAFLNLAPERCFTTPTNQVRIIGPGQWGFFLQRHLCHALQHNFDFLQRKWGVPDAAREFAAETGQKYGSLRLYPFVQRFNCVNEKEYHEAVDKGQPVTISTPHLVSPQIWNYLSSPPKFSTRYWPVSHPHVNEWYKHNPPPGTAYDPKPRRYHPSLVDRPDAVQTLLELREMAPCDEFIAQELLRRKYQGQETYAQAEEIYRPLLEYSAGPNWRLARYAANDPTRYEQALLRYSKLDAIGYFTLGRYFADRQQDDKAAAYYEKGVELCANQVAVANNCGWLVLHYFKKGERAKAEELADRAAEVYSSSGLRAKADLMELQENYDEALKYFLRIEERYNNSGPVVGFCVRYKANTGDSRFDDLVKARMKALFPRGLEKAGLESFKAAPEEGVLITQDNELLREAGLKKGDIIVALDGLRVYDMTQYIYVRTLTNAPLKLIVWEGSQYAEKNANPPKRLFGVQFRDYYQSSR